MEDDNGCLEEFERVCYQALTAAVTSRRWEEARQILSLMQSAGIV